MAIARSASADRQLEMLRETFLGLVRGEDRDLNARQLAVFLICYRENDPQTVRGLAHKLNVPKPAINRALDRLEKIGFLCREANPLDRRSVLAKRTAAGNSFLHALRRIMAQAVKAAEQVAAPEGGRPE